MREFTDLQGADISELDFRICPLNLICYGHQVDLFEKEIKEFQLEIHKE